MSHTPACVWKLKDGKVSYETSFLDVNLVPPSGDGVYTADGSPPIGTYHWNKQEVTYCLYLADGQTFADIPHSHNVAIAVNAAFTMWHLYSNLKFTRVPFSMNADVAIQITRNDQMFTPPAGQKTSNVMGYTYFPNTKPAGNFDCVLNADYLWSLDGKFNFSYNINETLRHELGHSWGAVHTTNANDIMYPFYHNVQKPSPMDIYQIQSIYGGRQISQWKIDAFFVLDALEGEFIK